MLGAGLCFAGLTGMVRWIGDDLPPAEAGFIRYLFGLIFVLPLMGRILRSEFSRLDLRLFLLRGLVQALAVILWFFAMARLPVADVTAMGYLTPIWITIGAVLIFGERIAAPRIAAIVLAFVGVIVILRPGLRELGAGYIAMLGVGPVFAISYLSAKDLTKRHSSAVIVGALSVATTIFLAPFALAQWVTPNPEQLAGLFVVAGFATAGHFMMTQAFQYAPMTVVQPVTFLQLIWATMIGVLIFNEPIDIFVLAGALIIVSAVTFIAFREARAAAR